MSDGFDAAVVGAGVVGLAVAAALTRAGRSVVVLERREAPARETTSRNSEVIHAGIYYPSGSFKARLCVEGREALYERCRRLRIPHRQTGKLIVATEPDEEGTLEQLRCRGTENGAPGLELLSGGAVSRLEPDVRARAGLLSPRSGILDAHATADSFLVEAEARGAQLVTRAEVIGLERLASGWRVDVGRPDGARERIETACVVNAAGLGADRVAALAGLDVDALAYRIHPCKGDYFALAPGAPLRFSHLVYPVHGQAGLGIHVTLDLAGRVRLGPDAEYVEAVHHQVDPAKGTLFARAAGRYLPTLRAEWLRPDYAGVRPKLAGPGEGFRDFVIREESDRGLPGLVNLIGIESPGLTAAPAIAGRVVALLAGG